MSIGDSSSLINSWKQRYKESADKSKDSKSSTDGIVDEALPIFEKSTNPKDNATFIKALKEFELTYDQKQKLYSALAKTPLSFSQVHKIDEDDIPCEYFSDIYEICSGEKKLEISRAELSTLGDYFSKLLSTDFREVKSKKIEFEEQVWNQFQILLNFMAGKRNEYDVVDPETWLALKNIAEYFQAPAMNALLPKLPKFATPRDAIEFAANNELPILDLSQFKAGVTGKDLVIISKYLDGKEAPSLSHLEELVIRSSAISSAEWQEFLPKLPQDLKGLDLSFCDELTDACIPNLPKGTTNLNIGWCPKLTDACIPNLPEGITTLNLIGCKTLTDACIPNLPKGIKEINLSYCSRLTDACIPNLPEGITALYLKECQNLTVACIPNLPKGTRTLDLSGCSQLTDACIPNLPKGIRTLDLGECSRLTDACIPNLPKSITNLNISWCNKLTDACIPNLPKGITTLCLKECYKVTEAARDLLLQRGVKVIT